MTPTELRDLGRRLHGKRWQTALARDLGVTARSVRRWLAGQHPIPPPVDRLIRALVSSQALDRA